MSYVFFLCNSAVSETIRWRCFFCKAQYFFDSAQLIIIIGKVIDHFMNVLHTRDFYEITIKFDFPLFKLNNCHLCEGQSILD